MPYIPEPTLETIYHLVIRTAAHFYWHLRRTGVAPGKKVEFEMTEVKPGPADDRDDWDGYFWRVFCPIDWKSEKPFELQIKDSDPKAMFAWKITNNWNVPLYPSLFYFDNSNLSISE